MARKSLSRVESRSGVDSISIDPTLQFDPQRLMIAISYHVLDEGLATELCPSCITATLRRFEANDTHISLSKSRWSAMSNPQRLEWLLVSSHTDTYSNEDGKAMFRESK